MRFPPPLGEWDDEDHFLFFGYNKKPSVIMQFTDQKDFNGKEIWEGDIVSTELTGRVLDEVIFDRGAFRVKSSRYGRDLNDFLRIRVKGNIFENPELLK
jgi:hypothetical protein